MMMDTAIQQQQQQQADSNGQTIVTPTERQALIQKLSSRWPADLSTRIENRAFDRSNGIKNNYLKLVQGYFQQVQNSLQNRANLQQQSTVQINNNVIFANSQVNLQPQQQQQQTSVSMLTQVQHPLNTMPNQPPRFSIIQQNPRMANALPGSHNPMGRLHEPQSFHANSSSNTLSYTQSPTSTTTTTIDLSQGYTSQQINGTNSNDYSLIRPRNSIPPTMSIPRQRLTHPNNNFPSQPSVNSSNDIIHQFVAGNSSSPSAAVNTSNSSNSDQLLQRILLSSIDGGNNKMSMQNRQVTPSIPSQPVRSSTIMNSNLTNSSNPLRTSLSPSPSVVIIPPPTQTSIVQVQPSNNLTIQQNPLNNVSASFPVISPTVTINHTSTPVSVNYSSPVNRSLSSAGTGSILSPDEDTIQLIKYLKDNVHQLQLLSQKFINENNTEKVRQTHSVHQQILQFISNPTYESLANAKHFRVMLDRIHNRLQQTGVPSATATVAAPTNVFSQCLKASQEFLSRDPKERFNVTKRYLEPLSDVINGVPQKMMRLDIDTYSSAKSRSTNHPSLLSLLNDEINQLPMGVYSIECLSDSRVRRYYDHHDECFNKNDIILRCKLLEKCNPIVPPLRLYVSASYPEQSPEVLSLTKTMPPKLEFSGGHSFFDQISSTFISHLFKLRPQHTITDILNIWRLSVQTAL